jgi:CHAD domain-containing protein
MPIAAKRSRAIFQKLEQNLLKLSSKPRAKSVHQLRTGTRRLQILLSELSPELSRSHEKLLKLLDRIRKRAGKVRDVDVQMAALRSLKIPGNPRRKTQLMQELIELRSHQERKLHKELGGNTVREIRKRLKRAGKDFNPKTTRDPLTVARGMIERIHREEGQLTEALLHQYRILSKQARYAAEFADESAEAAQFIAELKRLQDALGDWHDWLTLTMTAKEHIGEVQESPLVAELHNITGAKFRNAVRVLSHMRSASKPVATAKSPARATTAQNRPSDSAA